MSYHQDSADEAAAMRQIEADQQEAGYVPEPVPAPAPRASAGFDESEEDIPF